MTEVSQLMFDLSAELLVLFDLAWYEEQTGRTWEDKKDAVQEFLSVGWQKGFNPHPLFSTSFYLNVNKDVKEAGISPLFHFVHYGSKEDRDPHPMFSVKWYRDTYPEARNPNINPLIHYLSRGSKAGFRPSPDFDPAWYRRTYASLIPDGVDPLIHFVTRGAAAGLARNVDEENRLIESGRRGASALRQARRRCGDRPSAVTPLVPFAITQADLDGVELLSLDVWDTVLRRDCFPDEIKLQSARFLYVTQYWNIRPAYRSVPALFRRRCQVENAAAPKRDHEYRFSVAARLWLEDVLEPGILRERLDTIHNAIIEHEFDAERRCTRVDLPFRAFVEQATLPPTVFTSDFYLESPVIQRLLDFHGIGGTFVRGYSSCDTYRNKRTGELFHTVLEDFSVAPKAVLHVGDNLQADVIVPSSLGIRSTHYPQPAEEQRRETQRRAFEGLLAGKPQFHHAELEGLLEDMAAVLSRTEGYSELNVQGVLIAPVAVSFVLHIIETALRYGVKRVFFFTREGQFLKELYERIVQLDPFNLGDGYPSPSLLEVSRVSTFAASMESLEPAELMRLWNQYSKQSLRAFCKSLAFDERLVEVAARREGLDLDEIVDMPWSDCRFMAVLEDKEVAAALLNHIAAQRQALTAYLTSMGFLDPQPTEVIVDIGWRGTIQDNICRVARKHVVGCYLGLFRYLNVQPLNSTKYGWLIDYNQYEFLWENDEIAPLEMLFNGTGGSVVGYQYDGSQARPVRLVIPAEEAVVERHVHPIQAGVLHAADVICAYVRCHGLTSQDIRNLARQDAAELLDRPSPAIAKAFFELEHNELFGTGTSTDMTAANTLIGACEGLTGHQLHAAAGKALRSSLWKRGFLCLPTVQSFVQSLEPAERNTLPLDFGQRYRSTLIGRTGLTPRMVVYAPPPIVGSGGHRTIFNIARRVQKLGIELTIYLEAEGAGVGCVEEYLQGTPAQIFIGWERAAVADIALATIAHSAELVAALNCPFKAYLVQDFEAGFNPLSDRYIIAENSYCQGLTHFTIGNWLTHVLQTQYGVGGVPCGLGIDTDLYRPLDENLRDDAICFLYQPDKPRRAPDLGIGALRRVKKQRPDTTIYVYGSNLPLHLDFEVENLGLVLDLRELNKLYNRCKVGLCISMSNPSRIPYEMMAAGTVPIDLYRYNNLLDHEAGTAVLAYQSEASLAAAMLGVLDDETAWQQRSHRSIAMSRSRTLVWEQDVVANSIGELLTGQSLPKSRPFTVYSDAPVVAAEEGRPGVRFYCQSQKNMASLL